MNPIKSFSQLSKPKIQARSTMVQTKWNGGQKYQRQTKIGLSNLKAKLEEKPSHDQHPMQALDSDVDKNMTHQLWNSRLKWETEGLTLVAQNQKA